MRALSMTVLPDTEAITLEPLAVRHLDAAAALSRAEGWPHRREDWAFGFGLSQGVAATVGGRLVGTALATPFGGAAMLNMIIVAAEMRGRGLGRRLVEQGMAGIPVDEWRLVATSDGLPLYRKLGFVEVGGVAQHQGAVGRVDRPRDVAWATSDETAEIARLDREATGLDRATLIAALADTGRLAVLREGGQSVGYAAIRPFGRGEVAGPVVGRHADDAKRLLSFLFSGRDGAYMRVDTQTDSGLSTWLEGIGLAAAGGGVAMARRPAARTPAPLRSFALAAQAFG
jgi:predicted N-acetyltransferase YhbS